MATIKTLFFEAIDCAHHRCDEPLITWERGVATVTSDIAHIRSESTDGPRPDGSYAGGYDDLGNLLLLCTKHHRMVDRHESAYTVRELLEWKDAQRQRALSAGGGTSISNEQARFLTALSAEEQAALAQVARLVERARTVVASARKAISTADDELKGAWERRPVWTLYEHDDPSDPTAVTGESSSRMELSREEEEQWRRHRDAAWAPYVEPAEGAFAALKEELAVIEMMSGPGAVSTAVQGLRACVAHVDLDDLNWDTSLVLALQHLWRTASGDL